MPSKEMTLLTVVCIDCSLCIDEMVPARIIMSFCELSRGDGVLARPTCELINAGSPQSNHIWLPVVTTAATGNPLLKHRKGPGMMPGPVCFHALAAVHATCSDGRVVCLPARTPEFPDRPIAGQRCRFGHPAHHRPAADEDRRCVGFRRLLSCGFGGVSTSGSARCDTASSAGFVVHGFEILLIRLVLPPAGRFPARTRFRAWRPVPPAKGGAVRSTPPACLRPLHCLRRCRQPSGLLDRQLGQCWPACPSQKRRRARWRWPGQATFAPRLRSPPQSHARALAAARVSRPCRWRERPGAGLAAVLQWLIFGCLGQAGCHCIRRFCCGRCWLFSRCLNLWRCRRFWQLCDLRNSCRRAVRDTRRCRDHCRGTRGRRLDEGRCLAACGSCLDAGGDDRTRMMPSSFSSKVEPKMITGSLSISSQIRLAASSTSNSVISMPPVTLISTARAPPSRCHPEADC